MKMMENPEFRVDYGTLVSCHMLNPKWDKPIVALSSCRSRSYYNVDVMQEQALALGEATCQAVEKMGRRAVVVASNSLSHRHFTVEGEVPEDMSREHIYNHHQYLWDMRIIEHFKKGRIQEVLNEMPEFTEQAVAESDAGSLSWMLSCLGDRTLPASLYAYGSVIGTGNAVMGWFPKVKAGVV